MSQRKQKPIEPTSMQTDLISFLLDAGVKTKDVLIDYIVEHNFSHLKKDPAPKTKTRTGQTPVRWVNTEEVINIQGLAIAGGLFYFGTPHHSDALRHDGSVIDPKLSTQEAQQTDTQDHYRFSYREFSPAERYQYLQWLKAGRCHPELDRQYLSIYFYGLERRALIDQADHPQIMAELQRLLSIYHDHYIVRHHAQSLLNYLTDINQTILDKTYLQPPQSSYPCTTYDTLPTPLLISFGQMAKDKMFVPATWAWVWAMADERVNKTAVLLRNPTVLQQVFLGLYPEHHPKGIRLVANKSLLKVQYYSLSPTVQNVSHSIGGLPNISRSQSLPKHLNHLLMACRQEMDRYLRFIGRYPEQIEHLKAWLLLSPRWWPTHLQTVMQSLQAQVAQTPYVLTLSQLLSQLQGNDDLTKAQQQGLVNSLAFYQIGIVPNVCLGDKPADLSEHVALYRLPKHPSTDAPHADELAARLTLHAAILVMKSQSTTVPDQHTWLLEHLRHTYCINADIDQQLQARWQRQLHHPDVTLTMIKRQLNSMPIHMLRPISQALTQLAQCAGEVPPPTIQVLEKLYKLFDIDRQLLYSDLHLVHTSSHRTPHRSPQTPTRSFSLDHARIAQLQHESEQVAVLLADVFVEDTSIPPALSTSPTNPHTTPVTDSVWGLDATHSAFVYQLVQQAQWTRAELLALAQPLDLLLDGALALINEAAFDHHDDMLIEGDDPFSINPDLRHLPESNHT